MRLGDLLRKPELGIAVISGGAESLDRPIESVYITDLADPSPFLSKHCLVLSSGLWSTRPTGVETFLDAAARSGIAALLIGLVEIGHVPDGVIAGCRRRGIVLGTISDSVSFASIDDAVREALQPRPAGGVDRSLADAVDAAYRETGLLDALALFTETTGFPCWVTTESGETTTVVPVSPPARVGTLWAAVQEMTHRGDPLAVPGRPTASVWRIGHTHGRIEALLVVEAESGDLHEDTRRACASLASTLRPEVHFAAELRNQRQRRASSLFEIATAGTAPPGEVSALMRLVDIDPQMPLTVVAADVDDESFSETLAIALAERVVAEAGTRLIAGTLGGVSIAVVEGAQTISLGDAVAAHAAEVASYLDGRRMRIAASDAVTSVSQFGTALGVAVDRLADATGDGPLVATSELESDSYRTLLRMLGPKVRAEFAQSVLAPLIDYDVKHGADLIDTLQVFLGSGGAWQEAAKRLHVHPNTLRYRVARIEDLTRRDLSEMADRVDLFLALESRR